MRIAALVSGHASHQVMTAESLRLGATAHGDEVTVFTGAMQREFYDRGHFDAVCTWGWRRAIPHRDAGFDVLVMERAYVDDRFRWVSLGWNGLNGRARWPDNADPSRWHKHFTHLMLPWRSVQSADCRSGYALLLGQVPSDSACLNVRMHPWLSNVAQQLRVRGWRVVFRPHPSSPRMVVPGAEQAPFGASLADDLSGAAVAVTWNSNSGVDAALAGVPVIACDEGSMAWDIAGHDLADPLTTPDRSEWSARLAWRQWLQEEVASGEAWPHIRAALHG